MIARAKRCIVVTGAGISCSAGIPDFRSENGLYNLVKRRYPDRVLKGQELFDASLFRSPHTTEVFYTFMGELRKACTKARPTPTHHFLARLKEEGQLLRCYTQNIDGLERVVDAAAVTSTGRAALPASSATSGTIAAQSHVVQLHGTLERVRCTRCSATFPFATPHQRTFIAGRAPTCPACEDLAVARATANKRPLGIGLLRPDVVLYNETHPDGGNIAQSITRDLRRRPDLLLVMGTSLKVHGCKQLVREAAKAVRAANGVTVFVNRTPVQGKEWEGVFDWWVEGAADDWVDGVQECMHRLEEERQRRRERRQNSLQASDSQDHAGSRARDTTKGANATGCRAGNGA
ncbi:DHS-like NAD/FAD-binding domain-containing protein [Thamnocephalis sphaerospora]|uniref:DHS-like NAD/FAD-binding domain-containing protein n=1 Tax=Thamnocephalis sphaerospora TaxID=78915 RepID=A0A4P9XR97_9FUNG|nr:DHS-like NAD/FAD-binding domain-containing protein [Thamnocephalis sphaerospora]|eukprot:RKP08607.1 DHS-like NAD/FAD-binding domain-containing protein [Thamnocephalis sphaerospora]